MLGVELPGYRVTVYWPFWVTAMRFPKTSVLVYILDFPSPPTPSTLNMPAPSISGDWGSLSQGAVPAVWGDMGRGVSRPCVFISLPALHWVGCWKRARWYCHPAALPSGWELHRAWSSWHLSETGLWKSERRLGMRAQPQTGIWKEWSPAFFVAQGLVRLSLMGRWLVSIMGAGRVHDLNAPPFWYYYYIIIIGFLDLMFPFCFRDIWGHVTEI